MQKMQQTRNVAASGLTIAVTDAAAGSIVALTVALTVSGSGSRLIVASTADCSCCQVD